MDPRADPRSVTMRGGPPPSVGNLVPECSSFHFLAKMISRQGYAQAVEDLSPLLLGGSWGHVGLIFRNFSYYFRIFGVSSLMLVFFIDFFGFWLDFSRFGEGFGRIWG